MKKILVTVAGMVMAASAWASFSYQGALKLADGSAVTDSQKTIEFRLYTTATEDGAIWKGTSTVLLSEGTGIFNVELGQSDDSPSVSIDSVIAAHSNDTLYLGLTVVGSNGEIRPRQKLLAVPTAIFAQNVKRAASDFSVEGTLSVNGRITRNNSEVLPVPVGGIIMWSKATAPDGEAWATASNDGHWAICNGQTIAEQTTPDLRGRFVVGVNDNTAGSTKSEYWQLYAVGATGGEESHKMTKAEMPVHEHLYRFDKDYYSESKWNAGGWKAATGGKGVSSYSGSGGIQSTGTAGGDSTDSTAGTDNSPHENRPPYYALYYIMRVR